MARPTLAIDTASAACSAALIDRGTVIARSFEEIARGHAERLMPMVAALLRDAGVDAPGDILVGCGPGSFTGVRVGIAAAIGMATGWSVAVAGFPSGALVAASAFARDPALRTCAVAMIAGHGELFVERFARSLATIAPLASLTPAAAAVATPDDRVFGSGAAALVAARGWGCAVDRLPDAADAALLPASIHVPARPIYGRAPDAKPVAA